MTNEELKKKIAQIIADYFCSQRNEHKNLWGDDRLCYSKMNFAECERVTECTDALIAAGIGDVGETKEKLKKINERILLGDIIACDLSAKCAEYKYRAEVAERALDKACEDIEQLMDCCRWAADGGVITIKEYTPENATPQAYIDRAEKELTEGRKDD